MDAVLRIFRGDRPQGEFRDYSVPLHEGMVVLDAIHHVHAHQASDLAAAGFIEPTTLHRPAGSRHGLRQEVAAMGWKRPVRGFWNGGEGQGSDTRTELHHS